MLLIYGHDRIRSSKATKEDPRRKLELITLVVEEERAEQEIHNGGEQQEEEKRARVEEA